MTLFPDEVGAPPGFEKLPWAEAREGEEVFVLGVSGMADGVWKAVARGPFRVGRGRTVVDEWGHERRLSQERLLKKKKEGA